MNGRILIIDPNKEWRKMLDQKLSKMGMVVHQLSKPDKAMKVIEKENIDLVLTEVQLPNTDGIEFCTLLRQRFEFNQVLVAFITDSTESFTHVAALDAGGDDFISKSDSMSSIKSRVKALLRRHFRFQQKIQEDVIVLDNISMDSDNMIVTIDGESVHFPKKEFKLLKLFITNPGRIFTREELQGTIWNKEKDSKTRTVDVHIRKLRKKIGKNSIQTYKGQGYKYVRT